MSSLPQVHLSRRYLDFTLSDVDKSVAQTLNLWTIRFNNQRKKKKKPSQHSRFYLPDNNFLICPPMMNQVVQSNQVEYSVQNQTKH